MRPGDHTPGLVDTTGLVLGLRFRLFARRLTGRSLPGTVLAVLMAVGISGGLGTGSYLLFSAVPAIAVHPVWMAFALSMFFFLLGLFWVIWPVVAAQVDEAYELGRFFPFPVRPARLYLIQSAAGLMEPAVLFFYPPLVGAALGLSRTLQPGWAATLGLMTAYTLMLVATGRCLQNLFLNVMKSRRSGEFLFVGMLVFLGLSAFLPPVDASWLFDGLSGFGGSPEDLAKLAGTAQALADTPPGWIAVALAAAAAGQTRVVIGAAAFMLVASGVAWLIGLALLKRFYRGGRGLTLLPSRKGNHEARRRRTGLRLPFTPGPVAAVFEKELRTLTSNPKARLLFAVPFYLLILLKIIGAPQIFLYLWGDAWAAVTLALLGAYVLSVLAGQFFGNGFGYDGPGVKQTFLTPAPTATWLAGRNLAQGFVAVLQFTGLAVLLFVLVPAARFRGMALPLLSFPFGLLILLAVGNLLSARYPRRFHLTLSRRDRPVGITFAWVVLALGVCSTATLALVGLAGDGEGALWISLLVLPLVGAVVYRILFPVAVRWTRAEREQIIDAISTPGG